MTIDAQLIRSKVKTSLSKIDWSRLKSSLATGSDRAKQLTKKVRIFNLIIVILAAVGFYLLSSSALFTSIIGFSSFMIFNSLNFKEQVNQEIKSGLYEEDLTELLQLTQQMQALSYDDSDLKLQ